MINELSLFWIQDLKSSVIGSTTALTTSRLVIFRMYLQHLCSIIYYTLPICCFDTLQGTLWPATIEWQSCFDSDWNLLLTVLLAEFKNLIDKQTIHPTSRVVERFVRSVKGLYTSSFLEESMHGQTSYDVVISSDWFAIDVRECTLPVCSIDIKGASCRDL